MHFRNQYAIISAGLRLWWALGPKYFVGRTLTATALSTNANLYRSLFQDDLNSTGSKVSSVNDAAIGLSVSRSKLITYTSISPHTNQIICLSSAVLAKHRIADKNYAIVMLEL